MSTKQPENCPKCNTECMPNDAPVTYTGIDFDFTIPVWNYECSQCDWTWANESQRAHNRMEYYKKYENSKYNNAWMY